MKINSLLRIIILVAFLIESCTKDERGSKDLSDRYIAKTSCSFETNDSSRNFPYLINYGWTQTHFISDYDTDISNDTLEVIYEFEYEDSVFLNEKKVRLKFTHAYNAGDLENAYMADYGGSKAIEYELNLDEVLKAFSPGKYFNVLKKESNKFENEISINYSIDNHSVYTLFFSKEMPDESPDNEYLEIVNIEIIDNCNFIFEGTFNGFGIGIDLNDTIELKNGYFKGFLYNYRCSECIN